MRQNAERVAWVILLLALATLCVIIIVVPLGTRWYLLAAERHQEAMVESIQGTVIVEPPVGVSAIPLSKGQSMMIREGAVVRVDETSEAVITFFDHSFMRLFPSSTIRVERLRARKYGMSTLPNTVFLSLLGGRLQIGTALCFEAPLDFRISTLQGQVHLDADGSYAVEANNERSEVTAYRGRADVSAAGQSVALDTRQRTVMEINQTPSPPTGVARNLIVNGEFTEPLEKGWRAYNDQGTDGGAADGEVRIVEAEGRLAAHFFRTEGYGNHCETILDQVMDQPIPDQVTSLRVRASVQVRHQSLSGGGYLSSEYPLMVRITYRDAYDNENEWVQGFYYQNNDNNPITYGMQIPRGRWFAFESSNLLETLPVRPFRILRVRVYASGWDYESLISDISLIAE